MFLTKIPTLQQIFIIYSVYLSNQFTVVLEMLSILYFVFGKYCRQALAENVNEFNNYKHSYSLTLSDLRHEFYLQNLLLLAAL